MIQSTTPPASSRPDSAAALREMPSNGWYGDEVALGCECANPALQIERWGQEYAAQPIQQFN